MGQARAAALITAVCPHHLVLGRVRLASLAQAVMDLQIEAAAAAAAGIMLLLRQAVRGALASLS